MGGGTLRRRAFGFALCAGGVAFFLSLLVTANGSLIAGDYARALIPAIVCATMCWASSHRTITATAEAVDVAVDRLVRAADGDLASPVPEGIEPAVPGLAGAMASLFAQLRGNLERVERLALFDPVTQLPNRTSFRTSCESMLAGFGPDDGAALIFIDLDRFKAVNDTRGHAVGDLLLAAVAEQLTTVATAAARERGLPPPLVGRLSGDEFTIFARGVASADDADWIAARLLAGLAPPLAIAGAPVEVGASAGIACFPQHGTTLHALMRAADAAMYHAKAMGRGRAERYGPVLAAALAARAALEKELRAAIDHAQFALVFQPQQRLDRDGSVAVEALLRWQHPTDGIRLPASFLAAAEETGLILEIGDWVIARVARTIARWQTDGLDLRLAINVSPRQLAQAGFMRRLREALRENGAPARMLEIELSETLAMACSDDVVAALAGLRADGATIAIDGFGTGYSNVAHLRSLPIDRIKLDRSLVAPVVESESARTVLQSLISLAHGLGLEVVGEGIENRAQADMLRVLGCDVIQGYAVAHPMSEEALLAWIERREPKARAQPMARTITSA